MDTLRSTVARFGFNAAEAPPHPKTSTYSQGIGNTVPMSSSSPSRDNLARYTFWLRVAALFFFALSLICAVAAAVFQTKWIGATSGLTNFLLFFIAAFLLLIIFFTLVPWLSQRTQLKKLNDLERALREDRVGIVGNAFCLFLGFIVALTQLISTLGSASCKDPAKDAHANSSKGSEDDFKAALPSFCHTKRAETLFLWLGWSCFLALAVLFFLQFRNGRKVGPRIPPFVHPGGSSDGGAFQPLGAEDEEEDDPQVAAPVDDYRAAARYGAGLYSEDVMRYDPHATPVAPGGFSASVANIESRYGVSNVSYHEQHQQQPILAPGAYNVAPNPFADALAQAQPMAQRVPMSYEGQAIGVSAQQTDGYPRQSYDYGAYSSSGHPAYGARY